MTTHIDVDGLVILGPGSEWFWAMAQFIVLAITGLAIYRQFRAQGSGNALTTQTNLRAEWESTEMSRLRLSVLMHVASGEPGEPPALILVANFFANMAALRAHGHARAEDSWEIWSAQIQIWWALAKRYVGEYRKDNPGVWGEFEQLAKTMAELDRRHRVPNFKEETLPRAIDRQITRLVLRLRLDQEGRDGVVPVWPVLSKDHPSISSKVSDGAAN